MTDQQSGTAPERLFSNGSTITTYDELDELIGAAGPYTAAVVDAAGTVWIVYGTEDGDCFGATVPTEEDDFPPTIELEALPARGPFRVIWNGGRPAETVDQPPS